MYTCSPFEPLVFADTDSSPTRVVIRRATLQHSTIVTSPDHGSRLEEDHVVRVLWGADSAPEMPERNVELYRREIRRPHQGRPVVHEHVVDLFLFFSRAAGVGNRRGSNPRWSMRWSVLFVEELPIHAARISL